MRKLLLALFIVMALAPIPARASCNALNGRHVVLLSNTYDPDVLIWDSKQRLIDYEAGSYEIARILMPHALFARAGTKAIVVSCEINVVHPKYQLAPTDATGVKIISGPYHGRYGWVLSDDVRPDSARSARVLRRP